MSRRITVCVLALMLVAVLASLAGASDSTQASASMDGMTSTTASWAGRMLPLAFVVGIITLILSRFMEVKPLISIVITVFLFGAVLLAGPQLLAPFSALGATLR